MCTPLCSVVQEYPYGVLHFPSLHIMTPDEQIPDFQTQYLEWLVNYVLIFYTEKDHL